MNRDEFALFLRSIADQATRGTEPPVRADVEVAPPEYDEEAGGMAGSIFFLFDRDEEPERIAAAEARERANELLFECPDITVDMATDDYGELILGVLAVPRPAEATYQAVATFATDGTKLRDVASDLIRLAELRRTQREQEPESLPLEDDELAEALDPVQGPVELRVPGIAPCEPTARTKVVAIGFNIQAKGWLGKAYWTGEFADLERATYWGLKREREYKQHGHRASAHVCWQNDLTVDQVVEMATKSMNT